MINCSDADNVDLTETWLPNIKKRNSCEMLDTRERFNIYGNNTGAVVGRSVTVATTEDTDTFHVHVARELEISWAFLAVSQRKKLFQARSVAPPL